MENRSLTDRTTEILSTFINQEIGHVLEPRLSTYVTGHGVLSHCHIYCYPVKPYVDVRPPLMIYPSKNKYMYDPKCLTNMDKEIRPNKEVEKYIQNRDILDLFKDIHKRVDLIVRSKHDDYVK